VVCYNGMNNVLRKPHAEKVIPLLDRCWAVRNLGGAQDAMLVCQGSAELWVEPTSKPWDLAPLQILAQESGARYFDYTGADTIHGGNAIICVPGLEAVAREFLGLA
jgi:fructose-1,6-bisphosphatase/inositol monophosphatase family enzyme